ncbi:hypothetical protein G6F31_019420 [Rhizopus arrhizus]|uniref:Uncharacterized protein n=1 Tax=Rhizopus delemar TaxID=936053 RepID=A0A9P7C0Y5_9FUNG|nr:hypothetical protein G6F24_017768 [Rhizopus arrhizus]KAG0923662.1 hypothetical protein G6F31_019420 [Rhizopus arrhizus]KAG1530653.1 hypothetical protein G6F50_017172 [Rhizopus delemar]
MHDVFARSRIAVGQADGVPPYFQEAAFIRRFAGHQCFDKMGIGWTGHEGAWGSLGLFEQSGAKAPSASSAAYHRRPRDPPLRALPWPTWRPG